jgi:hypothetical protein
MIEAPRRYLCDDFSKDFTPYTMNEENRKVGGRSIQWFYVVLADPIDLH